jgi:hypothetical protein
MNNTTETGKETQAPVPTVVPIAVEARLASTDSEIISLNSRLGIKLFGEPSESVEFRLYSLKLLVGDCSDDKNALSLVGRVKKLEGDVGPTPDKDSASIQSRRRSLTSLVGRVKKLEGDLGTKETGEPWSVEKRLRRLTKDVMFDSNYALSLSRRVKNLEWNVGTKSSNEPYGNLEHRVRLLGLRVGDIFDDEDALSLTGRLKKLEKTGSNEPYGDLEHRVQLLGLRVGDIFDDEDALSLTGRLKKLEKTERSRQLGRIVLGSLFFCIAIKWSFFSPINVSG